MDAGERCTASGAERSVTSADWVAGRGACPDCGAEVEFMIRANDFSPRCKVKAHRAPEGVIPRPYGSAPPSGGKADA